jgi:hypothetical protein
MERNFIMKVSRRFATIALLLVLSLTILSASAFASNDTPSCGHVTEWHFSDSDECVICFEERIMAQQTAGDNGISTYSGLCKKCGSSKVDEVCANSKLIYSDNYYTVSSSSCSDCKKGLCDSPCGWLQYVSYMKLECNACGYSAYAFNSEGTGLAKHYCNTYHYCTGTTKSTCNLDDDVPDTSIK